MRPLKGHTTLRIMFLEQMLNERAHCIHTPITGVQPQSMFRAGIIRYCLELPVLDYTRKGLGEIIRQFVALLREAGFMCQIEGISLLGFVRHVEHHTEVGEVISHVSFLEVLIWMGGAMPGLFAARHSPSCTALACAPTGGATQFLQFAWS